MIIIDKIGIIMDHIREQLDMSRNNNLKDIKAEIENGNIGGRYCMNAAGNIVYVVGACATIEDYYYVVVNKDREILFESCIGEMTPSGTHPNNYSVLDWLIKFEPGDMAADIIRYMQGRDSEVMFTKVNINGVLY